MAWQLNEPGYFGEFERTYCSECDTDNAVSDGKCRECGYQDFPRDSDMFDDESQFDLDTDTEWMDYLP